MFDEHSIEISIYQDICRFELAIYNYGPLGNDQFGTGGGDSPAHIFCFPFIQSGD